MKKIVISVAAIALALAAVQSAHAKGPMAGGFKQMDADANGTITKAEFDTFQGKKFGELDSDGDGKLTKEEFSAHRKIKKNAGKKS